ncbi:hypothetical protein SK128_017392, partial [Halocaridina rubra]
GVQRGRAWRAASSAQVHPQDCKSEEDAKQLGKQEAKEVKLQQPTPASHGIRDARRGLSHL